MGSIGKLILVTGANGFIAAHTIIALLDGGYQVRGTVRSKASAETVRKTYSAYSDRFSAVVVPDMSVKNAFDEAVRGIDGVRTPMKRVTQVNTTDVDSGPAYCQSIYVQY